MIRFFHDKVQLMFFISVGFHVGLGCKPKPHMQSLAASDGSRSTDNGVCFVGSHVGFQLSGYGGHHGKGIVGVHVGFHVGFQL